MRPESPEQKYDRLRVQIQNLILKSYPNPSRHGCPGEAVIGNYARRAAAWDKVEGEPEYEHITHCSPCYREFLETREQLRGEEAAKPASRMSWFTKRRLGKSLDKLEEIMESSVQEVRR